MKNKILVSFCLSLILLSMLVSGASLEEPTVLKIVSNIRPGIYLDKLMSQPYILYFAAGKIYYRAGNMEKAMEMFDKAIDLNPDFAPAYHNKGVIYYGLGDNEGALDEFAKSVDIDPKYSNGYYSLGILNFELGKFDDAIVYFSEAASLEPENVNMNFDLGQAYVARFREAEDTGDEDYSDLENALEYLTKAQALQPDFPHVSSNIDIIESILSAREVLLAGSTD